MEKPTGGKPPAIVLEDLTLRHYAADGAVRVGHAEEVIYDRTAGRLEGRTIAVDAPPTPDLARGGVRLEAGRGEADLKGRGARLTEGVVARTGVGDVGRTPEATWDATTETFSGDAPIEAEGPGYRASADGFRFRVPGQQLELKGNVHIVTEPESARAEVTQ